MSRGGGDHGRNVHQATIRRMNARLRQEFVRRTVVAPPVIREVVKPPTFWQRAKAFLHV
jgi:hypothetical protein